MAKPTAVTGPTSLHSSVATALSLDYGCAEMGHFVSRKSNDVMGNATALIIATRKIVLLTLTFLETRANPGCLAQVYLWENYTLYQAWSSQPPSIVMENQTVQIQQMNILTLSWESVTLINARVVAIMLARMEVGAYRRDSSVTAVVTVTMVKTSKPNIATVDIH